MQRSVLRVSRFVVAAVLGAAVALAEPPDRDSLEYDLFATRRTWWIPSNGQSFQGLWRYEPETGEWERLRPLFFNQQTDRFTPYSRNGYGAFLAGTGDRLVFQVWPATQEWELGTWRLLRRYAPMPREASGWVLHGPIVSAEIAASAGIEAGAYGFPLCLRYHLTSGLEPVGPVSCDPIRIPGSAADAEETSTSLLVIQGSGPARALTDSFDLGQVTWETGNSGVESPPVLSLDPDRSVLYRGTPSTLQEWTLSWPPVLTSEIDVPVSLVAHPYTDVDLLFFHPRRDRFFCVTRSPALFGIQPEEWEVFSFRHDGADVTSHVHVTDEDPLGVPVTLAAVGAAPTVNTQLIPVVSRTTGINNTFWTAELWLYNPSAAEMAVTIRRIVSPQSSTAVTVPAYGSLRIPDALAWLGGGEAGDGVKADALVLTSPYRWGANLVAAARVSTPAEGGGSYGQAVPAVPSTVGYSNHLPYYPEESDANYNIHWEERRPATLTLDLREPGRFRHNLGIVNDEDEPVEITLEWAYNLMAEQDSTDLRPAAVVQRVAAPAHSVHIVSLEGLFPPEVRDAWPPRVAVYADRQVALWLSMVDNLTGDATFIPYTNLTLHTDLDEDWYAVPVVAHSPGREGTFWTTALYGTEGRFLHRFEYDKPDAAFLPADPVAACGGAAAADRIAAVLPGEVGMPMDRWLETLQGLGYEPTEDWAKREWRTVFPDVVRLFPACAEEDSTRGALEVRAGSWTAGFTRTFTTRADGGTYGSMLPFYPPHGWPVQHFAGIEVRAGWRVNVGLYNGQRDRAVVHRLSLYAADGTLAAQNELTLDPGASLLEPLATALGVPSLPDGTYGLTVLPLDDPETGDQGTSWAYVSLVDNVTGDPTNWW